MAMGNGEKTGKSTNWPGLSLLLAAMGSECRFRSIEFSVYGQKRKCDNAKTAVSMRNSLCVFAWMKTEH